MTRAPSLSHFHTVGKGTGGHAEALDLALATRGSDGGVFFDTLKIPDVNPEPGREVLFLDMLEVSALDNLQRSFHPMRKHPANPVLRRGSPGTWDDTRAVAYGEVLLDDWYTIRWRPIRNAVGNCSAATVSGPACWFRATPAEPTGTGVPT